MPISYEQLIFGITTYIIYTSHILQLRKQCLMFCCVLFTCVVVLLNRCHIFLMTCICWKLNYCYKFVYKIVPDSKIFHIYFILRTINEQQFINKFWKCLTVITILFYFWLLFVHTCLDLTHTDALWNRPTDHVLINYISELF